MAAIRRGDVHEYLVLAHCQDRQFAAPDKVLDFTCKDVATRLGAKIAAVRAAVAVLAGEGVLKFTNEDKSRFVLKGTHLKWGKEV